MTFIPQEALPYLENMIYLPMVLIVLARDREAVKNGPFKLKRPYVNLVDQATKVVQAELQDTTIYLQRQRMKVIRGKSDDTFTEYVFFHAGYEEHRRYLNVRLRNRTEELLTFYFAMAGNSATDS